ncbi:MAG: hypothetical protein WC145_08505 [Aliarcobacter sp.]|jgi:hypothetical protein
MAPTPAGYIISGAGEAAANGEYTNRGILINGMPSYTNGTWYLYLATEIMGDPPSSTWILSVIVTASVPDFGMGSYYVFPFGGPIGTWRVGEFGTPPAPTVEPFYEVLPYPPLEPKPWPGKWPFPEPELYPDELDPAEPMPHLFDDDYALWVTISGAEKPEPVLRVAVRRTLGL